MYCLPYGVLQPISRGYENQGSVVWRVKDILTKLSLAEIGYKTTKCSALFEFVTIENVVVLSYYSSFSCIFFITSKARSYVHIVIALAGAALTKLTLRPLYRPIVPSFLTIIFMVPITPLS